MPQPTTNSIQRAWLRRRRGRDAVVVVVGAAMCCVVSTRARACALASLWGGGACSGRSPKFMYVHGPFLHDPFLLAEELHEEEGGEEEQADDEQHQPRPALAAAHARHLVGGRIRVRGRVRVRVKVEWWVVRVGGEGGESEGERPARARRLRLEPLVVLVDLGLVEIDRYGCEGSSIAVLCSVASRVTRET